MTKRLFLLITATLIILNIYSQTTLTEAVNFHIKTIYGEAIWLFPILDDDNKIVVINFFSTTCGPCQDYAPDFQSCYENFGSNESNVYFVGINWGNDNWGVNEFDSIYGLTYPTASGSQGGGNIVFNDYEIQSYPTVVIITPDHNIIEQYVWYPDEETITNAVIAAGGTLVNTEEIKQEKTELKVFPNPVYSTGIIEFELPKTSDIQISIYNMMGQKVYLSDTKHQLSGITQVNFPVNELKNGYYFVKIDSDNGQIATTRFSVYH